MLVNPGIVGYRLRTGVCKPFIYMLLTPVGLCVVYAIFITRVVSVIYEFSGLCNRENVPLN